MLLVIGNELARQGFLKIDVDHCSEEFVHALFIGDVRVQSAPDEQYICQQFQDRGLLEEGEFLIGAIDILLDLLSQECLGLLS